MSVSGGSFGDYRKIRMLDLTKTVAPSTEDVSVTEEVPYTGYIMFPYISFPSGTNNTFGLQINDKPRSETMLPYSERSEYLYLDGVTEFFPVTYPVQRGDEVEAVYRNEHNNTARYIITMLPLVSSAQMEESATTTIARENKQDEY